MPALVIPDALPDIRYWLRTHPLLVPLHLGRVFFRLPDPQNIGGWPIMRIYRLPGGGIVETGGDTPFYRMYVTVECWSNGPPERRGFDFASVRQLAQAAESALWDLDSGTLLNPAGNGTRAQAALATGTIDSPDPDTGWPRMVVDTRWDLLPL